VPLRVAKIKEMEDILQIKELHTYFYREDSIVKAVEGVNFSLKKGEVLGLVGESGCGKSTTGYSILRLIGPGGRIVKGEVIFKGENLLKLPLRTIREIRGKEISIIFQEAQSALNPLYTIGFQIAETIKAHNPKISPQTLRLLVIDLLKKVGIAQPEVRMKDYPHNLSGGQAQRVMIAIAIANRPSLLIADEPTSNLDVTIQAQIIDLFMHLKEEIGLTILFITHNLALCSQIADQLAIMYGGKIVEIGEKKEVVKNPLHPYTKALFSSLPRSGLRKGRLKVIEGVVVDPSSKPKGCFFHPRCLVKERKCEEVYPDFIEVTPHHWVSCFKAK